MKYKLILLIISCTLPLSCGREKTPEELLSLAKQKYASGDYLTARKYLGEAIKLKPNDKEIVLELGKVYAAENMFDSAFANLSRADKLYPADRQINQLLHEASVKTGHWHDAIQALLLLAESGDSTTYYYRLIGEYALNDSSGHIAYYYFGKLIELEPNSLSHYLNQAEGAIMAGEPQNALEVLKNASKRFGDEPELLYELGRLYGAIGNLSEAEKTCRLLISKDSSTVNQLQLATILAKQKKRTKKEEAYAMFKRLRPETSNLARVDSILKILESELTVSQ